MLQDGTLLLYCAASWCMGRNTAYQIGGEVKHWLCHVVICCRTHWTPLKTVLVQGKKKKNNKYILSGLKSFQTETKSRAIMEPAKCQAFQVLVQSLQGAKQRLPPPEPCGSVDSGSHCSLANAYFTWRGKKPGRKHVVNLKIRATVGEICRFCLEDLWSGSL